MAYYKIHGHRRLEGHIRVQSAKNAVLPIMAATILASKGDCVIEDTPWLSDVHTIVGVIDALGANVELGAQQIRVNAEQITSTYAPDSLVRAMRASFLVMGPLLARMGKATVALPGGCTIGARPVDYHIKGFEAMGAEIHVHNGYADAVVPGGRLKGAHIYLDMPSVGATQNIMMAATLADGRTVIENAAKEPEVVDLAIFLNKMGAKIRGAGTDMIRIEGVDSLTGTNHTVIPDRIQAGTLLLAVAAAGGDVYIDGAISDHIKALIAKLQEAGAVIDDYVNAIRIRSEGPDHMKAVDVKTQVHPGFPTDLQAPMMALLTRVPGSSLITETVFENRYMQVPELQRMGADIRTDGRTALIDGVTALTGAKVTATDLRAGAAMVIAGLMADGITEVHGLHHIERGYTDLAETLRSIGAMIEKVEE